MAELDLVIERYQARLDARDIEGLLALQAPDATMMWLPVGTFTGRDAIRGALEMLFTAFPDFERTKDSMISQGNTVALEFTATGTFTGGPFDGYQPTGASGEVIGSELITVDDDGMIMSTRTYWDGMQMARELGLMPDEDSILDRGLHGALNVMTRARRVIRL